MLIRKFTKDTQVLSLKDILKSKFFLLICDFQ